MAQHSNNLYFHADGDSFFVGCELTRHPELRGRPVIVGADRGIAVAMSPEAKALGVTRGMPVFQIKKLFPEVVILPHHFDLYNQISSKLEQILSSYFDKIEVYSIDECFALVDPSEVRYFGGAEELLSELRAEIDATLGVSYSLGLARSKVLAKLASKLEKPKGCVMLLTREAESRALQSTRIEDVWGIGRRTAPKLLALGIKTALDFVNYSDEKVIGEFSRPLLAIKKELGGQEVMRVEDDSDPRDQKSIQSTGTFRPASTEPRIIWREIAGNAERACAHARVIHLVTDKVSIFIKTSEFKYRFDEVKLRQYTADPGAILNAFEPRFAELLKRRQRIRSTGVILHDLMRQEDVPLDLFGAQQNTLEKMIIEETADKIRKKYGKSVIKRAASMRGR